jgi:hypothetical protein
MKNVGLFSLTLFSIFLLFLEFPGWENRRENVRILSGTAAQASKRGETVRLACFEIKRSEAFTVRVKTNVKFFFFFRDSVRQTSGME